MSEEVEGELLESSCVVLPSGKLLGRERGYFKKKHHSTRRNTSKKNVTRRDQDGHPINAPWIDEASPTNRRKGNLKTGFFRKKREEPLAKGESDGGLSKEGTGDQRSYLKSCSGGFLRKKKRLGRKGGKHSQQPGKNLH